MASGHGLAAGRTALGLEEIAIDHIEARIAECRGPAIDRSVEPGAPAHFAVLPLKTALRALRDPVPGPGAVEANISYFAGSLV